MVDIDRKKLILLEFNEITWTLLDPFLEKGRLPNFMRLKREGAWASPISNDQPPYMDPWITWVTVHTGVERNIHGASVLEQAADTIQAKASWDYVIEAGQSVGIFGSIGSYPPRPVNGFWIPASFAPGVETFPAALQPIQELNCKYTKVHNRVEEPDSYMDILRKGIHLIQLGLQSSTATKIAWQLAHERLQPSTAWKRISLQPLINFDLFNCLYRRYRPVYATWHTNHVAHYMHHYWRSMDDSRFLTPATLEEKQQFGGAVEYGYIIADQILGRFMKLIDDKTVLVLASSMGQQPYISDQYPEGRIIVYVRDIRRLLEIVGVERDVEVFPVMAPQWNVVIPQKEKRRKVMNTFLNAYRTGEKGEESTAFSVSETGATLTITPKGLSKRTEAIRIYIPEGLEAAREGYTFDELFMADAATPKEGMHHPQGVLMLWGNGIRKGVELQDTTNLDIAPTILALLGLDIPPIMQGRILSEAWNNCENVSVG